MVDTWKKEGLYGISIKDLSLKKTKENNYSGTLETIENGESFSYPVKVVVYGDEFEWEIVDDNLSEDKNQIIEEIEGISTSENYCSLSNDEFLKYLTKTNFNINGNGSVYFSKTFDYSSNMWKEGKVTISGGGQSVSGMYSIIGKNTVYLEDVMAVSGIYDASNNNGSSGAFTMDCEGNLSGSLSDGNNIRDYIFYAK